MALTYSRFMYGWEVTTSTNGLKFVDNGTTYTASIALGVYTPAEYAAAVQTAMRTANTDNNNNTCTFSFSTRKFTLGGTSTFQLLWTDAATTCPGFLGFDESADDTGATSYTSDGEVGATHSDMTAWVMTLPNVPGHSPVTAAADGSTATRLGREVVATQNITDGGKDETIYIDTRRTVEIGFDALDTSEQTNMEALLDWIEQGYRFNWQPDKDSTNALRLVWRNPGGTRPGFTWNTASEVSYGTLTFLQSLSRT